MFCELWIARRYLGLETKAKIVSLTALISVLGIAIGVMVLIVVISVMSGFDLFLQDKMVGTNAHLSVEFYPASPLTQVFIEKLKRVPHIRDTAVFVTGQAFIKQGTNIVGFDLRGIDPVEQLKVSKLKEYLERGSLQVEGNEVVLGEELAFRLGLRLGDKINLISPVTLVPTEFTIKGLFNTGMYIYDTSLILTSIKAAQDFFKLGNSVSGIALKTDDIYHVERIKEDIYFRVGNLGQYEVKTWVDTNRNFLNALKIEKIVMFIVVTMTTVVAAFGIVATLIMSVMTKIRDIGILRSVGAKARSIMSVFILQGLGLGLGGIILGMIAGVSLVLSLSRITDFISKIIGRPLIPQDIYYFDRIPTNINCADISIIVASAVLISLLASIYPAFYATRVNPNEAIRNE